MADGTGAVLCVDIGSTYTKGALVDPADGSLLGTAVHPTTLATDVLVGVAAVRAELASSDPRAVDAEVLACSSAGGGLRIAVVGNEELVTAEAGRRVALSSGGKVVAVEASPPDVAELLATKPDLVLLTGGTDGGNAEPIVAAAGRLRRGGWRGPVVVAGNLEARADVVEALGPLPHVLADNVLPRIGALVPGSARTAVREMFLAHVIGGKHLSSSPAFATLVRGATPDLVLTGVEVLAGVAGCDVVVVDVGGATTDVHSVVALDPEAGSGAREVVGTTPVTRTVEGDLGMRWSAVGTALAGSALATRDLMPAATVREADPAYLPATARDWADDLALATVATVTAMRRHAGRSQVVVGPDGRVVERTGTDLRSVGLLVGSGGVLRSADPGDAHCVLAAAVGPTPEGYQLPEHPRVVVDERYVLAAVGLLASPFPEAARVLAGSLLTDSLSR